VAGIIVPLLTILNDKELYNILFKKKHMLNIEKNINSLLHYMRQPNSDSKFLDLFVSHQGLNFSIFQNLIESVYQEQGSYEYFAQILNVLDYRVEGQSNMVKALDVLFTEDVDMVEDFLLDVFDKFNVPSVTLESTQVN